MILEPDDVRAHDLGSHTRLADSDMSLAVCLSAPGTLSYPEGGGHLWVAMNWALGLREVGCRVVWLEKSKASAAQGKLQADIAALKKRLQPYGLDKSVALYSGSCPCLPS